MDLLARMEALLGGENAPELRHEIAHLREDIRSFKIRVPLLGKFSTGKSTLLNETLFGREMLKTETTPETALAMELHHSETPRLLGVTLHDPEGRKQEYPLEELPRMGSRAKELLYMELHFPMDPLQSRRDVVMVDMPGIDSGNEAHQKALELYAKMADFFVLFTTPDSKIDRSLKQIYHELGERRKPCAIIMNKCGKMPFSEVQEIMELQKGQIRTPGKEAPWTGFTECRKPRKTLEDFYALLDLIQGSLDEHLHRRFDEPLARLLQRMIQKYTLQISMKDSNTEDLARNIRLRGDEKRDLEENWERVWESSRDNLLREGAQRICQACMNALNPATMARTLQQRGGKKELAGLVQDAIRYPFDKARRESLSKELRYLGNEMKSPELQGALISVESRLEDPRMEDLALNPPSGSTSLWESLLNLISDILSCIPVVGKHIKKNKDEREQERLQRTVEGEIMPQLRERLEGMARGNLEKIFPEIKKEIQRALENRFGEIENTLQEMITQKKGREEEHLQLVNQWQKILEELEEYARTPWLAQAMKNKGDRS